MWRNAEGNSLPDDNLQDQALPLPIQIFLWRQISPFIRPKLGKLHEASCMFCQQAPGHHELKEACKSFEKVLVQNIQYGLSPSLTEAVASVPRWRLIQAAFPHVMHCMATLLHNRKDTNLQNLGATETKMLYTLHWILLVAAEECADADHENGIFQTSPFYYLFSIPAITLFIYLFAPIHHHLKESDFQTYRLENGLKMWQALWDYRHPDTPCFTAHVKPKPRMLWNRFVKGSHLQFGDVFMGRQQSTDEGYLGGESPQSQSASASYCSEQFSAGAGQFSVRIEPTKATDEEGNWVSSPKDTVFPETIPEESSSTEEEHVVIFRLPSLTESDGVEKPGSLYTADASIFHMAVGKAATSRSTLTIEQVTALSGSDTRQGRGRPPPVQKMGSSTDKESVSSKGKQGSIHKLHPVSTHSSDVCAATFLDVAVLRCLFMSQWPEEGVFWALQFYYHRLREMSEEMGTQQQPRRRSNSLPIPKIEVSIYQSPEMKKKDPNKDFIEVPEVKDVARLAELPNSNWKQSQESVAHTRRASEKSVSKKRMKMADLRTFVETKLLSKSERTLEKIGAEDQKPLFLQQEYHHSLDAGEENLARPASALAKILEHRSDFKPLGWGNLVKGKSMPSLRFIGDHDKHFKSGRMLDAHSHTITNPIITVTEHTPTPSPDFLKRQVSVDSQLDEISLQGKQIFFQERKPSLTRSQTDSNITYTCEEVPEAPGAACYITKDGDINIQVVLKAVHSAALRDNICCTLRVCEVIFNLLELLMDMGVLKQYSSRSGNSDAKTGSAKDDKDSCHSSEQEDAKEGYSTVKNLHEKHYTPHDLVLNSVLRVYKHLGCPHGCGDGQRGPPADFLRSQGQTILSKLQRSNPKQFARFLRNFVRNQTLAEILEFFHSYVGFCVDPSSLLSPLNQKRSSSKSPEIASQGGYATNFGAGLKGGGSRGVEGQIMASIFKTLVTRLVKSWKELKTQENMPLYCDVRQLMSYIKEAHGGVFRRVALSGLIDSANRPNKRLENVQTTKVIRHAAHAETEDQTEFHGSSYYLDEKGQRKLVFKKRSTSSTCTGKSFPSSQGTLETESIEDTGKSQSPLGNVKRKHQPVLVPRQSEKSMSISDSTKNIKGEKSSKLMPKIGGIVSWFKKEHGRTDSTDSHDDVDNVQVESSFQRQQSVHYNTLGKTSSKGSSGDLKQALQKTRKRVEDQIKRNFGFRKGKKKDGSMEETSGTYTSRKSSMDYGDASRETDYVIYRERKLVQLQPVLHGMMRFSFLLETCHPGSVPDHHLLAAILDLPHAPVVSRAALLLECAYFVHNCNKGQWPTWMKLNFPVFRPSMPNQNRGPPSGMRRTHILQRSSGKLFYQWAEAIGNRLEEMLQKDKLQIPDVVSMVTEESRQKELFIEDEEEDFLDEASVNFYGNECPIALRMIACILLLEITAFLRETYQLLPKSSRSSGRDRPPQWERMYSKEANRRWSMALSSMGHSQASAQSLQSIAGDRDAGGVQSERKISFVLHEPDNESEGSSNTTVTMQGEDGQVVEEKEKKSRSRGAAASGSQTQGRPPFLLRRGTATNATVKRTDSIQSKRKVSSLSDRSDTSEPGGAGEVSGEESPGILSDDQPPESPSDSNETDDTTKNMPWMKVVVQLAHSFNFYCSHQSFCHPFCYRRHMRACERLMKAVRKVYGEESGFLGAAETESEEKQHEGKKEKGGRGRKVSDQTSTQASPVRRKDSIGRKEKAEKVGEGARCRDSDQDVEKNKVVDSTKIKWSSSGKPKETLPILKYLKTQVRNVFHAPLSVLVKGAVVLTEDLFIDIIPVAWELLLESDQEVAASAASLFILCSVRAPNHVSDVMHHALSHQDTSIRINAILRFQVLWKLRYQVWPRMEEGAHVTFKVPPPGIEFTLPSPKIGIESLPVVDPPWIPQVQTKVEEVTISQESHRSLVTATKTRKKQQTELITMALQAQEDKKRVERENFLISTIPITVQAAYQPSLYHTVDGGDHDEGDEEQNDMNQGRNTMHHTNAVHSLFPSCLCSAVIQIISLLDDAAVSSDGNAVYEVAYSVIWNCLVEDSALFLRYILERITREKQEQMFKILRHLIRFVPKLPQQAAFALYNYIIGYIMFYVRSSHEEGQQYIGTALSILWMVVHSVHGIMFKDLKQILRKEQCDASILLTANVPSAKKIIVHGPQEQDAGGIPSQFPVQEDTQFCQILRESLDFFGVEEARHKEYFLVDHKTRQIHNPSSYVRDFYFFKRSQYPQLELIYMKPEDAFNGLQRQELIHKFVEIGKVLLTWAILKNVDMVVQRVVFLHEELMKLPSFPRKALEADLDLYKGGELGKELLGLDVLHKFMWVRLISRMFEAMAGNFAYSGDIHLLLNVLNGALILHSEDSCILRYVMATYINAAHNFKNIFSTNGYLLIMPTLLQIYSNHQTNKLVTRTVEYCVKQFYLMNRKPFILQMFGSLSAILDTDEDSQYGDAHKVQAKCLFQLLLSLETPSPDPLNIGELVKEEKPLKAIDFCYHDESEMVTVLDCISLCIMVIAYASDSVRGHQMLIILEAILPYYLQQIQKPSYEKDGKTEKEIIQQLAVAIRTLVHNCEALAKNYNGPQRSSPEHKGSSQKNYGRGPYSPGFEFEEDSHSRYLSDHSRSKIHYERGDLEDSEVIRNEFRRPRDILLSLVAYFHSKCTARLAEINKKTGYDGKNVEILDVKSHLRLVDIAHSLLKVAPYDPDTMGCRGLQRYINDILPSTEWSNDAMRPALITILRRLDKTFNKIYKKSSIRRHTDWDAAAGLLKGIYETLARCPYIAHMQHLKTLINTCQSLILGEASNFDISANEPLVVRVLMTMVPPPHFCSTVVRLIVMQILAMGENYSLEQVCGSSVFPNKKKTESMLMNLIIPLCMRVGSGRKDAPRMRQQDISFALTVVLHAMCPPATLTAQNIKSLTEMRSGSLAFGREAKKPVRLPQSTYQVSFLALKIIIVCFENELTNDWPRIAKTVKDVGRVLDLGSVFWNFLDFVASQRTPLFVLLLPFINQKVNSQPLNDQQRHMQFIIREKLKGYSLPVTKCRSALLIELAHEIKELKEELENGKIEDARMGDQMNTSNSQSGDVSGVGHARHHRPSLIGGLFAGAADLTTKTNQFANEIQMKLVRSQRNSVSSVGEKKAPDEATTTDETSAKGPQAKEHKEQQRKLSVKLRFGSDVEMKDYSGETSITPLSPGSPNDESSGEANGKFSKPRLQRSKAQSRKTFRVRKSHKSRMEKTEGGDIRSEKQSYSTPTTPTQITPKTQQFLLEQLKEAKLKELKGKDGGVKEEDKSPGPERGDRCPQDKSNGKTDSNRTEAGSEAANSCHSSGFQCRMPYSSTLSTRNNLLKAELSLEEDTTSAVSQTSSTSGYRESCSLITMTMESPTPMRPSSIPATTSPDSSLTSNGGDETAVLARSSSSQHSLMMLFETQDEDTVFHCFPRYLDFYFRTWLRKVREEGGMDLVDNGQRILTIGSNSPKRCPMILRCSKLCTPEMLHSSEPT
ncbi:UNVERIFIED_CONTAM: hypothetical protein PYX00_007876 [Menopon gallinae]|uniref:Protein unc-80 homolog n=1 Tax=Menopon gallinae TaxID=328185 RepID=A0AAW2HM05_9NEOP